ncbi:hypothetical protein FLBR109950_00710 [Flavobacterium branchiophilum]
MSTKNTSNYMYLHTYLNMNVVLYYNKFSTQNLD